MKWEKKTLDQLGSISRGKSKHRPRNDPKLFGGDYPFIQTADVKNANFYITEYSATYNEAGLSQSKLWEVGTLCITIAANIADTGILGIPACFPDSVMGFIPYDGISDVRFVKYCFDMLQEDCKQISQGTTQDNLSWQKLSTIEFPAPSIEIQRRIADILSAYDDLIENNQKQIRLLEEAAQRLYKEWFVDLRFPGHEHAKIIDGVPEGWEFQEIVAVLKKISRTKHILTKDYLPNGAIPVIDQSKEYISGYTNDVDSIVNMDNPVIVFGDHTRILKLIPFPFSCGAEGTQILMSNDERVPQHLFYCALKQIDLSNYHYARHFKFLKRHKILIPSKPISIMFETIVSVFFKEIDILRNKIRKLRQTRESLLPKLINSDLDISSLEK